MEDGKFKIQSSGLNLHYVKFHALKDVNISIKPQRPGIWPIGAWRWLMEWHRRSQPECT